MNRKIKIHLILIMAGLTAMTITSGCGIRYTVHGTVIDMDTGQPVEGAVVSVLWKKYHLSPPGLGGGYEVVATADFTTNVDGKFRIPKYTFRDYHLAAYKKGYVCWESEDIFPDYKKRVGFKVKNGMVIDLVPFRDFCSLNQHAYFVNVVQRENSGIVHYKGRLYRATKDERELYDKISTGE